MSYLGRAYLGALMVGSLAPVVGSFITQRRQALIGDGLGHLAFAGAAAAALFSLSPVILTLLITMSGAALLEWLQRFARARADVALSVVFYIGIGSGVLMLSATRTFTSDALTLLFGSLLTISESDLVLIGTVLTLAAVIAVTGYRTFFFLVFDERAARVAGVRTGFAAACLTALTASVIVAGMRAVGVLLVAALLVIPAAAAQRVVRSFRIAMLLGSIFGAAGALGGVWLAIRFNTPPGATIVLLTTGFYLLVVGMELIWRHFNPKRRAAARGHLATRSRT